MDLELSQSQKQILSQRMQLSAKILQMNAVDLEQYICDAALENPLIELDLPQEMEDLNLARLKKLEWLDRMDESNSYKYAPHSDNNEQELPLFEKHTVESLYDTLMQQVPGFHLSPELERIVHYLIGNLDENGYTTMSRQQFCQNLDVEAAQVEEALSVLYRMDPPGCGAQDLRESLLIQARHLEEPAPVLIKLIDKHLDLLAKNQLAKLADAMGVSLQAVKAARAQLLTLNPKPGNGYSSYKSIPYIRPDLFIVSFGDGYQVILNDYNQPSIEISKYYRTLAKDGGEIATYVNENLNRAEWMLSCIQQRKETILRCSGSILRRQMRFFKAGPGNLVSMTHADVARDLELHPSTISRAIRDKYLQCQWGVFSLASFFSHSVNDTAENPSQDMALDQIKRIIAAENSTNPFSDQDICTQLQKNGTSIARRTVAKYREQLGIPPASRRKQF